MNKIKGAGFIIIILILASDQLSKFIATKNLLLNQSVPLIKGILHLSLVHNRGAAFGILKNQTMLFILTSLFAIILIYFNINPSTTLRVDGERSRTIKKYKKFSIYSIALSLILAGALGNLIDRIFLGYVIDFLDFRIWPVFNVADSAITIGAALLGWSMLKSKNKVIK